MRNIELYGFGIKSFTLSMVETAIEVTEGRAPAVGDLGNPRGRPRDGWRIRSRRLPHARETLEALTGNTGWC